MALSETLIMAAANAAPRWVERLVRWGATNPALLAVAQNVTNRTLGKVDKPERIGVVADTNIGDAVLLQGACSVFKHWLPHCHIDFFYQAKAEPLLRNNPHIDGHHPVFTDSNFTASTNQEAVRTAILQHHYDLILNLYPFLMNSQLRQARCPVLVPYGLITGIVQAERHPTAIAHVAHQLRLYVNRIARHLSKNTHRTQPDPAIPQAIYLSPTVPDQARDLLHSLGVPETARIALLNPDSSSRFSQIPLPLQSQLVRWLLDRRAFDRILIGPSYNFATASKELHDAIASHPASDAVLQVPAGIPIDTYAGLVDRADLLLTSDTAQMHIAAAKRDSREKRSLFRNRTALLAIFGATNSRIYGYDSSARGYMDSLQHAPSKVFEGTPHCKTLTCIHKTRKNCPTVECFNGLDLPALHHWIQDFIHNSTPIEAFTPMTGDRTLESHPGPTAPATSPFTADPIIVVSGLPRSGTSLMMQMLEAGGVSLATDGLRTPDEDNPRGYHELERTQLLHHDASWLTECRGKAVKIVSPLLNSLPSHLQYQIIFMERRLAEVLASQKTMQLHRGTADPNENEEQLSTAFQQHLAGIKLSLAHRHNVRTLFVSYSDTVASPLQTALQVRKFLQRDLNTQQMAAAVDEKLYRQRQH